MTETSRISGKPGNFAKILLSKGSEDIAWRRKFKNFWQKSRIRSASAGEISTIGKLSVNRMKYARSRGKESRHCRIVFRVLLKRVKKEESRRGVGAAQSYLIWKKQKRIRRRL